MKRQWHSCSLLYEAGMPLLTVEAHLLAMEMSHFQCGLVSSSPLLLAGCLIVVPNLFFQSFV